MKTLIVFLFALSMFTNVNAQITGSGLSTPAMPAKNAQTNSPDIKTELLNLLKSKHDYEKVIVLNKSFKTKQDPSSSKENYVRSFAKIKENKAKILAYINNALRNDTTELNKKIVSYTYKAPYSSIIDYKSVFSYSTYFKIIKYSLMNQKDSLPPLSEISFITKGK
jgi:hypothetical protein